MYENNTLRSLNPCYTNCIFKTLNKPVFNNFYNFFRKISNNNISKLRNLPQSVIWSWVISARATDRLAKTKKILPTILSSLPLSLSLCVWVLTDSTSVFMRISREIIQNCLFFCSLVIMEDCLYGPWSFLACHILFYFHKVIKVMKKETFKINFFQEKKTTQCCQILKLHQYDQFDGKKPSKIYCTNLKLLVHVYYYNNISLCTQRA